MAKLTAVSSKLKGAKAKRDAKAALVVLKPPEIHKICVEEKHCPVRDMIRVAKTCRSEYVRLQANAELMRYIYPQLKSIEVKQSKTEPFTFNINI